MYDNNNNKFIFWSSSFEFYFAIQSNNPFIIWSWSSWNERVAFHEWVNRERLMKSPIVTGNLFSVGKIPTTPEDWKKEKKGWFTVESVNVVINVWI